MKTSEYPKLPLLSSDKLAELIREYQETGNPRKLDRIILSYVPLARKYVARFHNLDDDQKQDLLQAGLIGLRRACNTFDPGRDIEFATYALWWIKQEVRLAAAAATNVISRPDTYEIRRGLRDYREVEQGLTEELGRPPLDAELADRLNLSLEMLKGVRTLMMSVTSLDRPVNDGEGDSTGIAVIDTLQDENDLFDDVAAAEQRALRRQAVADMLGSLSDERLRIIVEQRLLQDPPATLHDLAETFGISRERVRQLQEKAMCQMRDWAAKRGLTYDGDTLDIAENSDLIYEDAWIDASLVAA